MTEEWTNEEIHFLKFAYPNKDFTVEEISEVLNKSKSSINNKAKELGLKQYIEILPQGYKKCRKCGDVLPLSDFVVLTRVAGGRGTWCKNCMNSHNRNKKVKFEINNNVINDKFKVCSKCKNKKNILEFSRDRSTKDGYEYICKDCRREYRIRKIVLGGYNE